MAKIDTARGYLIHHHPFQNSSLILHFFSMEKGRFHLLAKGIRSNKNLNHLLSPFQLLNINYYPSLSMAKLKDFDVLDPWSSDSLLHKAIGMYFNELLYKALVEEDPSEKLFIEYQRVLSQLKEQKKFGSLFMRRFEMILLEETGFNLKVDDSWDEGNLIIDKSLGLTQVLNKKSGTCLVSDWLRFQRKEEMDPPALKRVSKLIYDAIDLAVNYKPIYGRELVTSLWKHEKK